MLGMKRHWPIQNGDIELNARERRSLEDATIQALVKVRDEHGLQHNRETIEALLNGLHRLIDVNNFDGRTRRARNFEAIRAQIADVKHEILDYLLEFRE